MVWIGEVLVVACQDDTTLTHGVSLNHPSSPVTLHVLIAPPFSLLNS